MTFFSAFPHRLLSAVILALACAVPLTYAAELEGTPVPVDSSAPVPVQIEAPIPVAPEHPDAAPPESAPQPPSAEDHERRLNDNERWAQDNERQNWQHDLDKGLQKAFEDDAVFNAGVLIPILAILFIFGGPVILLILLLVFFFGSKRRRQQDTNMNIDKLLAAGRDIPVELLRGDDPKSDEPVGSRDKGIRNIFLGTGWLVFLTVLISFKIGAAGFIWIALGASQVLIWYLNRPNVTEQAGQQD